jgi:hypothetical protein
LFQTQFEQESGLPKLIEKQRRVRLKLVVKRRVHQFPKVQMPLRPLQLSVAVQCYLDALVWVQKTYAVAVLIGVWA